MGHKFSCMVHIALNQIRRQRIGFIKDKSIKIFCISGYY